MHPIVLQYLVEAHIHELHRAATPRAPRHHRSRLFAAARSRANGTHSTCAVAPECAPAGC